MEQSLVFSFFLIFTGAAAFASVALYTRQPLLVAYIVLGAILGPYGMSMVSDTELLSDISHIGIVLMIKDTPYCGNDNRDRGTGYGSYEW